MALYHPANEMSLHERCVEAAPGPRCSKWGGVFQPPARRGDAILWRGAKRQLRNFLTSLELVPRRRQGESVSRRAFLVVGLSVSAYPYLTSQLNASVVFVLFANAFRWTCQTVWKTMDTAQSHAYRRGHGKIYTVSKAIEPLNLLLLQTFAFGRKLSFSQWE